MLGSRAPRLTPRFTAERPGFDIAMYDRNERRPEDPEKPNALIRRWLWHAVPWAVEFIWSGVYLSALVVALVVFEAPSWALDYGIWIALAGFVIGFCAVRRLRQMLMDD